MRKAGEEWSPQGEDWCPNGDESISPAASEDTVGAPIPTDFLDLGGTTPEIVEAVIQMTLGKALQAQQQSMKKLTLAQQHHAADVISQSRELFSAELTKMIDEQRAQPGCAVITADNIKDVLEQMAPRIQELMRGAGAGA